MGEPTSGFAFLEHTADIGIRAWGTSLPDAFERAGVGLATLMGATAAPPGRTIPIHVEGADAGGLLVAFLDELVYRCETTEGEGLASLRVTRLDAASLDAVAEFAPTSGPGEGLVVKAATYHQLDVSERPDGTAEVRVYLDV
jgi:SHS2 domain-containing protein